MKKGQVTKEHIISQAAGLFNTKGYTGASLADLMKVTGLKKGGIYNHFNSKEEILLEAFNYSINQVEAAVRQVIKEVYTATEKLKAVINFYRTYALYPVVEGGCPILNSTLQSNVNPILKERVQTAYQGWIDSLSTIIQRGIRRGEFKTDIEVQTVAIYLIAACEGGIVMARAFNNNHYMDMVADQLITYIDTELRNKT